MTLNDIFDKIEELFSSVNISKTIYTQEDLSDVATNSYMIQNVRWKNSIDFKEFYLDLIINFTSYEDFTNLYDSVFEHKVLHVFDILEGGIDNQKNIMTLKLYIMC